MLVEGYTQDGEQCAWTLEDMEKMRSDFLKDKTNEEKFKIYYEKNFSKIVGSSSANPESTALRTFSQAIHFFG